MSAVDTSTIEPGDFVWVKAEFPGRRFEHVWCEIVARVNAMGFTGKVDQYPLPEGIERYAEALCWGMDISYIVKAADLPDYRARQFFDSPPPTLDPEFEAAFDDMAADKHWSEGGPLPNTMKTYIGCKIISATPSEKDGQPGYAVFYPDGYSSWSPKDTFELAYREITDQEGNLVLRGL